MWNPPQGTEDYTFFLNTYVIFTKTDLVVGHKASLNKFRRTEVIQSMFSNHNIIRNKIRQISFCKERNSHHTSHYILKWITDLNIKPVTLNFLEERVEDNLVTFGYVKSF